MMLDILIAALGFMAIMQGLRNGLVMAVFSLLALVAGLAAATKLSAVVAVRLSATGYTWLPFLSFLLVFITVVLLVRIAGNIMQRAVQWSLLGWVNRLAGVAVYLLLYGIVISVFLFYLSEMRWLSAETSEKSFFYNLLYPIAPTVIEKLGAWIPVFKDVFIELQQFFGTLEDKI